eukprot:Selendium_serpulae@DN2029_c0_g1_i1.p1
MLEFWTQLSGPESQWAGEIALQLPNTTWKGQDGHKELLKKLDKTFLADADTRVHNAHQRLATLKRERDCTVADFIITFERITDEAQLNGLQFGDAMKSHQLLEKANHAAIQT